MAGGRIFRTLVGLALPSLIAVAITLVLMNWHKATRVELALSVDRVAFTIAPAATGDVTATLLDAGRMSAVRADRVALVVFEPSSLEMADETRFDLDENRFPDDAWQPLAFRGEVILEPARDLSSAASAVALQPAQDTDAARIRSVRSNAGTQAVMGVGRSDGGKRARVTLALDAASPAIDLVFPARFLLYADYMGLSPAKDATEAPDSLSLRAGGDTNTAVRIQGSERGLVVQLEPRGSGWAPLAEGGIPVSTVDFTRQGPSGERLSSLVGPGSLRYPDLPAKGSLALGAGELVNLEDLQRARIESLGISHRDGRLSLKLTLDAVASLVRIGTPEQPRDARLTWFDQLWHSPVLGILFAIVVWLFPTTLAGYKLWKELRSSSVSS